MKEPTLHFPFLRKFVESYKSNGELSKNEGHFKNYYNSPAFACDYFSTSAVAKELEEGMHLIAARKLLISKGWRPIKTNPVYGGTEKILINAHIKEVESCAMDTPLCIFNYKKDDKCLRLYTEGEEIKDMRVTSWSDDCPEQVLQAQNQALEFGDYPVAEKYRDKNAPVVLSKKDRIYRTRLKEAAKQKPNFAGHYILTTWGCGME